MKVLVLLADGFEDLTLYLPWYRLREEGFEVHLASPMMHGLQGLRGYRVEPDLRIHEAQPYDYSLLLIPDGPAVERLRLHEEAVGITRTFVQEGWPVAAIGHGPQLLLSAGALDARRVTCSPGIRDDIRAGGGDYRDEPFVLENNLLTCRGADDLPAFNRHLVRLARTPARVG